MSYTYCTIAVGEFYLESAKNFAKKLNSYSHNHHMIITTNIDQNEIIPNTIIHKIPNDLVLFIKNDFNYMTKYYPIELAINLFYDFIIFVDADWRVKDSYKEINILNMLSFMNENNFDMLFERPHRIGAGKHDGRECFWNHKINFYKLLETDIYDDGDVCNEQFMVFKNTDKLKIFIDKFKELYTISTEANLWPFAEGLEIGMSMCHAKLITNYRWNHLVPNMFEFNSKDGGLNTRF